ncbi:hypothetical protein AVEN_154375-1 [Araneus ventricosus]|uniref:Uncharacterized protein n=1 Tax=Araneus ventricosus TaxID=182803 RepID=A0A4Y2VW36_ARAVE|nr:hypothetical protein AVEN_154375-1 [Araneus ventricosus]
MDVWTLCFVWVREHEKCLVMRREKKTVKSNFRFRNPTSRSQTPCVFSQLLSHDRDRDPARDSGTRSSQAKGEAEGLNLSDLSMSRTNPPTTKRRLPSGLIIGSGQNVTAPVCRLALCGLTNDTAPSSTEPLWVCVRWGRFTTSYASLFRCLRDFLCGPFRGNQRRETSQKIVMARRLGTGITETARLVGCSRSAVVDIHAKWIIDGDTSRRCQGVVDHASSKNKDVGDCPTW